MLLAIVTASVVLQDAAAQTDGMRRRPSPGGCDEPLQAATQREPLSQVLRRLAAVRPFRLEYRTSEDPTVLQPAGRPVDVMALLAREANMLVSYRPHPSCPGQWRIGTVWVLPSGSPSAAPAARPVPAIAAPPAAATVAAPVPDPALENFMRAHGQGGSAAPEAGQRQH